MAKPSKALLDEIKKTPKAAPNKDRLNEIRMRVDEWRKLALEKAELSERLTAMNIRLNELEFTTIPDLMDQAGIDNLKLAASGNYPAVNVDAKPYYKANIAADWPDDQRHEAFEILEKMGSGDLIKTEITVSFARTERVKAKKLIKELNKAGYAPAIDERVHPSTLTAWLKEQAEAQNKLPPLEKIGAKIGRIAKMKLITP